LPGGGGGVGEEEDGDAKNLCYSTVSSIWPVFNRKIPVGSLDNFMRSLNYHGPETVHQQRPT